MPTFRRGAVAAIAAAEMAAAVAEAPVSTDGQGGSLRTLGD